MEGGNPGSAARSECNLAVPVGSNTHATDLRGHTEGQGKVFDDDKTLILWARRQAANAQVEGEGRERAAKEETVSAPRPWLA